MRENLPGFTLMAEIVPPNRGERAALSYKLSPSLYHTMNKLAYEEKKFSTVSDYHARFIILRR
jgi:hypothetical protein